MLIIEPICVKYWIRVVVYGVNWQNKHISSSIINWFPVLLQFLWLRCVKKLLPFFFVKRDEIKLKSSLIALERDGHIAQDNH